MNLKIITMLYYLLQMWSTKVRKVPLVRARVVHKKEQLVPRQ